jgi:hypothetical protein
MEAAAEKLGWDWVVAAVGADGRVQFLDPARAKQGKEIGLRKLRDDLGAKRW